MADFEKIAAGTDKLEPKDWERWFTDKSERIANELMKYARENYTGNDSPAVAHAMLAASIAITKAGNVVSKDTLHKTIDSLWDNIKIYGA